MNEENIDLRSKCSFLETIDSLKQGYHRCLMASKDDDDPALEVYGKEVCELMFMETVADLTVNRCLDPTEARVLVDWARKYKERE